MKHLTIIDTFGFFFRNYYAIPPLKNRKGFPTNLLTGFANFINSLDSLETDSLIFALDSKNNKRCEIYSEYKANRKEAPDDLKQQLSVAISWIEKMKLSNLSIEGYEADDIIATISKLAKKESIKVTIVSTDKDLYQLIDENTTLFDPVKKIYIDREKCLDKFKVEPKNFIDYQSIVGDSSDNVPGVKGIGAKGAERLINEYQNLDNIYANIDKLKAREQKLLNESKEVAYISKELVTLKTDLFKEFDFEKFDLKSNPLLLIEDELKEYEIKSVLNKLSDSKTEDEKNETVEVLEFERNLITEKEELFKVIDSIKENSIVGFDTESSSLDTKEAKLIGFSFAFEAKSFYVPINHNYLGVTKQIDESDAKEAIVKLLKHKVVGHNLKFDFSLLYNYFNIEKQEIFADTMILAWLLSPESSISLDSLSMRVFNYSMIKYKDIIKNRKDFSEIDIEVAKDYASEDAFLTYKLYFHLIEKLDREILEESKLEFEFINILIDMENEGIKLDIKLFERVKIDLIEKLKVSEEKIHELSDSRFNVNSPKQLGEILFNQLKLPVIKKTKTGFSTDEKVLHALLDKHEIIAHILSYRELYKLKSTYIEPLLKYAKANDKSRIFTSLLQTGTQTGRLSSKNPNLQNIPTRSDIRAGFIAKDGYKLIGIDYSQIELRLLAHFSEDEALIKAFQEDKDIHLETSIKIFGERAREKRAIAKTINFGLIYGMGANKLSSTLKSQGYEVSNREAKEYIEQYFDSFPSVKNYIDSLKEQIEKDGYVKTLLNRKRYFDFSSIQNYQREAFLREGVNTLFQGSSADIIKLAMLKIDKYLKDKDAKMLLQIHDELLFEVKEEEADKLGKEIKNIMESIYSLKIPLKSDLAIGDSWGELK